jgi:phage/plasmid-like protein (TIGR03299 family)
MITPWEDISTDVRSTETLAEAMDAANVAFSVEVLPAYFRKGGIQYVARNHNFIVRTDINAVLGYCKTKFRPLQNHDAFDFLGDLIERGWCELDYIGTLGVGQKVWALAAIHNGEFRVVDGDNIKLYLTIINSHDGKGSVTVCVTPIRITCANMFSALGSSDDIIKFNHSGNVTAKLEAVKQLVQKQLEAGKKLTADLRSLATCDWPSPKQLDEYFRDVFHIVDEKEASAKSNNKVKKLHELFIHGKGNSLATVRGTWYAAYNAVSEYLNYEIGRSSETRLTSLWFGVNGNVNTYALRLALERSNNVPQ